MCGIAGIDSRDPADRPEAMVRRMVSAMRHRGPDDAGLLARGRTALGHARLSIVDVRGGHQPLFNEDGSVAVVFNGEIYNAPELRSHLASRGHRFATRTDTECLVHLYEEHGADLVLHLHGMFAFALWDDRRERLLLARDAFGIKPLVIYEDRDRFAFASDLDALFAAGSTLDASLSDDGLGLYFALSYIPGPTTAYARARKLPPGHLLTWDRATRQSEERAWFDPGRIAPDPHMTAPHALALLRAALDRSVERHLMSDVPLGAFLSGGVDSSLVVSTMRRVTDAPVRTFSIGFSEAEANELPYAREVARRLGTEHTEEVLTPAAVDLVGPIVDHLDEPFGDSSAIPMWCVARMAREHVTVALSGDGGDELFLGYARYARQRWAAEAARAPRLALDLAAAALERAPDRGLVRRARALVHRARLPEASRYAQSLLFFQDPAQKARVLSPAIASDDAALARLRQASGGAGGVRAMALADTRVYLPDDILTKVDRMTMAFGLEARVPLLDLEVAELALRIPTALHMRGGSMKRLLRQVLRERLPASLVDRPKQGFAVPLARWMRGPLRQMLRDVLLDTTTLGRGLYRRRGIEELLAEHDRGLDRSGVLWLLLTGELWLRRRRDRTRR
jgi:asparagine synthase (glutamine-hydrolysing)